MLRFNFCGNLIGLRPFFPIPVHPRGLKWRGRIVSEAVCRSVDLIESRDTELVISVGSVASPKSLKSLCFLSSTLQLISLHLLLAGLDMAPGNGKKEPSTRSRRLKRRVDILVEIFCSIFGTTGPRVHPSNDVCAPNMRRSTSFSVRFLRLPI